MSLYQLVEIRWLILMLNWENQLGEGEKPKDIAFSSTVRIRAYREYSPLSQRLKKIHSCL